MLRKLVPEEHIAQARDKFLEIYPELGVAGTRPMPGASQLLEKLRIAKHRTVVISAKSLKNLELSLTHLQFEFDEVHGGASGQEKTELMIGSKVYLYVGDQESDVVAATNAGVKAVFVNESPPKFNTEEYPCEYFQNLVDLYRSIDGLINS